MTRSKPGMVDPVSCGVLGEGKVFDGPSVNFVIESKGDTEAACARVTCAGSGECDSMKGVRQPSRVAPMSRTFDGEVRKLYDSVAFPISDSNETSACRHYCFLLRLVGRKFH